MIATPRQSRHLDFIVQFTTNIHHISEIANAPADTLSRSTVNTVILLNVKYIDFKAIAQHQTTDRELQEFISHLDTSRLKLESFLWESTNLTVTYDSSTGKHRPFIPACMHCLVLHSIFHPGIKATQRLLTARFARLHIYWDT